MASIFEATWPLSCRSFETRHISEIEIKVIERRRVANIFANEFDTARSILELREDVLKGVGGLTNQPSHTVY